MTTKKQLQNQIFDLYKIMNTMNATDTSILDILKLIRENMVPIKIQQCSQPPMINVVERLQALEKYLGIEYKIEDTYKEGYVKVGDNGNLCKLI